MRVNRYKLRHRAREGHRGARLAEQLLSRPNRLLGLILFGNNLVNFFAAFIWTVLALRVGGMMGAVAGTILLTLIVLVFAEITPKTWAAARPEKLALIASRIYVPMQKLLWPIVWAVNLIAGAAGAPGRRAPGQGRRAGSDGGGTAHAGNRVRRPHSQPAAANAAGGAGAGSAHHRRHHDAARRTRGHQPGRGMAGNRAPVARQHPLGAALLSRPTRQRGRHVACAQSVSGQRLQRPQSPPPGSVHRKAALRVRTHLSDPAVLRLPPAAPGPPRWWWTNTATSRGW